MAGVAGQLVALREGRSFDIALVGWRGQPERVARDSWLLGTGLSAPVVMLAVQAAATVRLGAGPSLTATRTLGFARRGDGVRIPCRAGIPQRRPVPRRLDSDKDAHRGGRICIRRRDGRVRPAGPRQHLTLEVSRPTNHHHHAGQFSTVDKGSRSRRRRPFPTDCWTPSPDARRQRRSPTGQDRQHVHGLLVDRQCRRSCRTGHTPSQVRPVNRGPAHRLARDSATVSREPSTRLGHGRDDPVAGVREGPRPRQRASKNTPSRPASHRT